MGLKSQDFRTNILELKEGGGVLAPSLSAGLVLNFCDIKRSVVRIYCKKCHSQRCLDTIERQVEALSCVLWQYKAHIGNWPTLILKRNSKSSTSAKI
jgi:hypothetical protein